AVGKVRNGLGKKRKRFPPVLPTGFLKLCIQRTSTDNPLVPTNALLVSCDASDCQIRIECFRGPLRALPQAPIVATPLAVIEFHFATRCQLNQESAYAPAD